MGKGRGGDPEASVPRRPRVAGAGNAHTREPVIARSLQPAASHRKWTAPHIRFESRNAAGRRPQPAGRDRRTIPKATLGALAHPLRSRRAKALRRQRSSPSSGSNRAWHGPRRGRSGLRPGSSSRHAGLCPISRVGKPHDAHSPAAHQTGNSPSASRESSIGQGPRVEAGPTMMRVFPNGWHTLTTRTIGAAAFLGRQRTPPLGPDPVSARNSRPSAVADRHRSPGLGAADLAPSPRTRR
jgi:hypothetical protein